MAFKTFAVEGIGDVTIYKRRGARSLRLTIRSDGTLRVTIPPWTPYATGVAFARSRADWLQQHARPDSTGLSGGQQIGKAHRLMFKASTTASKPSSRIRGSLIVITHPMNLESSHATVQKLATTASIRALRTQAEQLLPIRLQELAQKNGFSYRSVSIKQLKTRWGSCDQSQNIKLNLFLMQLPWHLIDYVILHELTHTKIMQHGPIFWQAMERVEPRTPALRKEIKTYNTSLQ